MKFWSGKYQKQNIFTTMYALFVPFAITDSRFGISFVVTGFVCLQVTEAVHFFYGAFRSMQMPLPVCTRECLCGYNRTRVTEVSPFICGALSHSLTHSRSPAATFALAQSNGERSNQTTRGPHSSSYLSPLLLLFEPG